MWWREVMPPLSHHSHSQALLLHETHVVIELPEGKTKSCPKTASIWWLNLFQWSLLATQVTIQRQSFSNIYLYNTHCIYPDFSAEFSEDLCTVCCGWKALWICNIFLIVTMQTLLNARFVQWLRTFLTSSSRCTRVATWCCAISCYQSALKCCHLLMCWTRCISDEWAMNEWWVHGECFLWWWWGEQ